MDPAVTPNEVFNSRPDMPHVRRVLEIGGLWNADQEADPARILEEARARGVRALQFTGKDLSFVADLPQLRHLVLGDAGDIAPAMALPHLRDLDVVSWEGSIDAAAWPDLEGFAGSEPPRGGGGVSSLYAHPRLERLALGKYAESDLTPIAAPRLRELRLAGRRLESLAGVERLTGLDLLRLARAPRLFSISGVEKLPRLEVLVIDTARLITDLHDVGRTPALRLLDIGDQRGIASLAPLAGHPTLEYLLFARTEDMSLEALATIPHLRLVSGERSRGWQPPLDTLPDLLSVPEDHPDRQGYYELRLRY